MPTSPGSVGLARAHPLTKTHVMKPSRHTWSSYGPPYPLGCWSSVRQEVYSRTTRPRNKHTLTIIHTIPAARLPFRHEQSSSHSACLKSSKHIIKCFYEALVNVLSVACRAGTFTAMSLLQQRHFDIYIGSKCWLQCRHIRVD